ncbi:AfsR/SARP family transcriptional regulator [Streptomyces prasinus]|uniref:AfsR/SARP family transcriptional regulator n=1 Tax=Streptomyces prasinus TaxID=67345 RepID=UPI0037CD1952
MQFRVLGSLEVWATEERLVRVPEVKVRALLASLLAHPGRVVAADRLVEALWGGSTLPANPLGALQAKVSQLRRALEEAKPGSRELIAHRAPGYVLTTPAESVDAGQFQARVADARAVRDPRVKATVLADALSLWRGPAFADFADKPFIRTAAAALEEQCLTAVEEHAEARLELGEHSTLIGELTRLVAAHPLRERLRAVHMRSLYRVGRSSEALDSYAELRRLLDRELGLSPGPAIETLQQAILCQDPALQDTAQTAHVSSGTRSRTNLPARLDSPVGRDEAVAELRQLVREERLATLTGPGGVGKTRLATATARELDDAFPDGVWLVELAGLSGTTDLTSLAEHVMAVMGIREDSDTAPFAADAAGGPIQRLVTALTTRRLLLILDNCEHLVDAVTELVTRLLDAAPQLHLMATSQERLHLPGETIWPVPPLSLPPLGLPLDSNPDALQRCSAVQLFAARARAVDPDFVLDETTAPLVSDICRRLDGLPLALELAATRVRSLGLQDMLDRLDDRFRILTYGYRGAPPRQQTLQAALDWSWSLLTGQEQYLLRTLAVHAEGCTLEAIEHLSADGVADHEILDVLTRLVDRSLVIKVDDLHWPRYRLLESVAAYAQRKTHEQGESARLTLRHLRYYTELAELARSHLHSHNQRRWLQRLDAETANFQRALDEAERIGAASWALRLVNALSWYWFLRGRLGEGSRALRLALAVPGEAPAADRAEARTQHTGFAMLLGEHRPGCVPPPALPAGERADPTTGERTVGRARAEWFLGFAEWSLGALSAGEQRVNGVLTDFRVLRDAWGVAAALSTRAALAMARGNLEAMRGNALEARAHFITLGDAWGRLKATEVLSVLAEINADYDEAARLHSEGLHIAESLELWSEVSRKLSGLGRIALLTERLTEADELHSRALRLAVDQGNRPVEQFAEIGLALAARRRGLLDVAEGHLQPWLEWNRSRGALTGLTLVLAELGFIAEQRGDAPASLRLHRDCLATAGATGDARAVALALEGLAGAHSLAGRHTRAARLLGTAAHTREECKAPLPPAERGDVERISVRIREALGEEEFRKALDAGAARHYGTAAEEEKSPLCPPAGPPA